MRNNSLSLCSIFFLIYHIVDICSSLCISVYLSTCFIPFVSLGEHPVSPPHCCWHPDGGALLSHGDDVGRRRILPKRVAFPSPRQRHRHLSHPSALLVSPGNAKGSIIRRNRLYHYKVESLAYHSLPGFDTSSIGATRTSTYNLFPWPSLNHLVPSTTSVS